MRRGALFIIVLVSCAATFVGCATAPHPLLRAFAPSNIVQTTKDMTTVKASVAVHAKVPYLEPQDVVIVPGPNKTVLVRNRGPLSLTDFLRYYQQEMAKRSGQPPAEQKEKKP